MKCGVESVKCEVNQVLNGSSPSSLYAVRLLILLQRAQLLRCFQTELKRRTCIVSNLSLACAPYFALHSSFVVAWGAHFGLATLGWTFLVPKLPRMCLYTYCSSPGLGTSHRPPQLGIVSHNLCVSSLRRVFLLSFLRPLWDAGFLVFPIPLSTPVTALGQFSFRQVSPLGSPFVSLLVAALQRGEFLRFACFERYHSVSLVAAMRLTYVIW